MVKKMKKRKIKLKERPKASAAGLACWMQMFSEHTEWQRRM